MKNYKYCFSLSSNMRKLCMFLLLIYGLSIPEAQGKDSLFHKVADNLHTYHSTTPREKIYVHQDRIHYAAGETIWLKIYQSFSLGVSEGSQIVYVDLADRHNRPVSRSKWKLINGLGEGHIELPDSLPTGHYQLRAYTKWMQNFDPDGFFSRELLISSDKKEEMTAEEVLPIETFLSFYPEGGSLVSGMPSRLAFKVNDAEGKGLDAKGVIMDGNQMKVTEFETVHLGMGYLNFEPGKGKEYFALLSDSDVRIPLPQVYKEGVVLRTRCTEDNLRLTIQHNLETLHTSPFYLTIHQEDVVWFNAFPDMSEAVTVIDIDAEKLPAGVFTITLYDETGHVWCERLAFVNFPEHLDMHLSADKPVYAPRERVQLSIDARGFSGQKQSGNFSLAVVKSGLDAIETRNNYYTDYFLKSELRGRIEDPVSYFENRDLANLNLLLMIHGWRRYFWEDIVRGNELRLYFPVEKDLTFSGRIQLRNEKQKPESVDLVAMFRHDSIDEVVSTQPGKGGVFLFEGYDFCDTAEVILSAKDKKRTLDISVMKHPDVQPDYYAHPVIELPGKEDMNYSFSVEFGVIPVKTYEGIDKITHELPEVRVTSRYKKRDPRSIHDPAFNKATYYARKDFSYGSNGAWGVLAFNYPKLKYLKMTSLLDYDGDDEVKNYILDGMYVSKADLKMIPSFFIDRIEILSLGSSLLYGGRSIFFYTRSWEDMVYSQPVRTVSYKFAGYNQQKEFYSPNYDMSNDYFKPDYRNTLYWQPSVTVDREGRSEVSFFTSDEKGEYLIHCEGRSDEGVIGIAQIKIEID